VGSVNRLMVPSLPRTDGTISLRRHWRACRRVHPTWIVDRGCGQAKMPKIGVFARSVRDLLTGRWAGSDGSGSETCRCQSPDTNA
jgi:hypothetical protein